MKYQLISIGTTGDVAPMIALGAELKRRGGEASLAAFEDYRQMALNAGIGFTALPGDLKCFIENIASTGSNPIEYLRGIDSFITPIVAPLLGAIYRVMSECDAVIFTFFGTFMYSIASRLGVKSFEVDFIPLVDNGDFPLPLFSKLPLSGIMNPLSHYIANMVITLIETYYVGDALSGLYVNRHPISADSNKLAREAGVTILCAFSQALVPRPAKWGDNVFMTGFWDLSKRFDFKASDELQKFMSDRKNILYAGFGSMRAKGIDELFEIIAQCAGKLGVPLVASTGLSDATLNKHADVFVPRGFLPHGWLFDNVDYVIHHGGAGTMASGLRGANPTFVTPFFGDQPFWGDLVAAKGVGPKPVKFNRVTYNSVYKRMKSLVTETSYRENALAISKVLKSEDGVNRACDIIIERCQ